MYAFEYEVVLDDFHTKTDEVWSTIVLSHSPDADKAKLEAIRGATPWVQNLVKTLENTSRSVRAYSSPSAGEPAAYRCHVRFACVAHLLTYGPAVVPVTEQRGGSLVQTVWVPSKTRSAVI
jgi:hypothetical protein